MVSAFNLAREQNMYLQSEESQNNLGIPERELFAKRLMIILVVLVVVEIFLLIVVMYQHDKQA